MYFNERMKTSNQAELNQLMQSGMYQSLFELNTDPIWMIDLHGIIHQVNKVGLSLIGTSTDQHLYTPFRKLISLDHPKQFLNAITSYDTFYFNAKYTNDSEEVIHLKLTSIPIIDSNRLLGRFVQAKVEEHEQPDILDNPSAYWESFMDHSTDAIGLFDLDGNIIKLNKATEHIFLYSREELLGNKVITIPDESYRKEVDFLQRKVKSGKSVEEYETIRKRKDGKLIDVSITYSPIYDKKGNLVAMANILRDITDRKKAHQGLRESEAKYRLIAENTADMIRVLDLEGKVTYASPSHQTLLGRDSEYYERIPGSRFVHPHDFPVVKELFLEMVGTKQPINFEYREQHADGNWLPMEAHCMPVFNGTNEINSVVMVVRDLTERKHAEELLRNSDKLAVIGQMAASIAHEIRNPLTSLKGFLQYFQSSSEGSSRHYYDLMLSELDRINLIVSEFLLLAKPQVRKFQKKKVDQLLTQILMLIDSEAVMNNVEIIPNVESDVPSIYCDENQLKQAFLNYIKNAIEASARGSRVEINVMKESQNLKIDITDYGCGISEEDIGEIGKPFYTTKESGTGLGLMISQKIILNHKGTVSFKRNEGSGTTVRIELPIE